MKSAKSKANNCALADLALCFATEFVDSLNSKSFKIEMAEGFRNASGIFEQIRRQVIRQIAVRVDIEFSFAELVDAYEFLLDQRLSIKSGKYEIVHSENEKRRHGVFYTPDALARELATLALRPLVLRDVEISEKDLSLASKSSNALVSVEELLSLRIVDPAMGAGTFLLTSLDVLTDCIFAKLTVDKLEADWEALHKRLLKDVGFCGEVERLKFLDDNELKKLIRQVVAHHCLYGLDVDNGAVELARIGLAMRCLLPVSTASENFPNLRSGNALLGLWQSSDVRALGKNARDANTTHQDRDLRDVACLRYFSILLGSETEELDHRQIAEQMKIFHWDLEFPEVFSGENPGFDLVLTNPPWEIEKPNSREFFSRFDSDYMSLSKQSALVRQEELMLRDSAIRQEWNHYVAYHEGLSEFIQRNANFQSGGDSNAYKLFLERGYQLLRTGGIMAQIVPSGIYSDKGATALRRLFVEKCRWLFLRGYHNREGIFPIHKSFKFCTLGIVKGGQSNVVDCDFLRVSPGNVNGSFEYRVDTLTALSPEHLAFMETPYPSDLSLMERLAESSLPLGSFPISFRRELDMTNDSKLFVERTSAQREGFALDMFGHWLKGDWKPVGKFDQRHAGEIALSADGKTAISVDDIERVLLPVYEGRMVGQYDWAKKAWLQGKGRRAEWSELPFGEKKMLPQYLLDVDTYVEMQPDRGAKVAYLAVGASTNSRSCIAAMIGDWPCGNSVPVLTPAEDASVVRLEFLASLLGCLNSFVFDYLLRLRLSANNLNWFILKECLVPDLIQLSANEQLRTAVAELSMHPALRAEGIVAGNADFVRRMKLRAFIEATIAAAYCVEEADCEAILRGCEFEGDAKPGLRPSSVDKGFHRLDLHLEPKFRAPSLFLNAFKLLQKKGAIWLFDNLDSDDVLFSNKSFEQSIAKGALSMQPSLVSDAISKSKLRVDTKLGRCTGFALDCTNRTGDPNGLLNRIRNAGARNGYPGKVRQMSVSRLLS